MFQNVEILGGADSTPDGCREEDRVANEKNRHIDSMKQKHPDWDWDYWMAQVR